MSVLLRNRVEIALRSLNQPEREKVYKAILSLEKASNSGELIKRHHWRLNLLKLPSKEKLYSFRVGKTLRLILSSRKSQWIVEDIINHDRLARLLPASEKS
jgi:hypothetical protein